MLFNVILNPLRSSVFRAMFESESGEEEKGVISVEDTESEVLIQLLQYLYAGKVEPEEDEKPELITLAIKYLFIAKVDFTEWEELTFIPNKYKVTTDYKDLANKYWLVALALMYNLLTGTEREEMVNGVRAELSECEELKWIDNFSEFTNKKDDEIYMVLMGLANKYGLVELSEFINLRFLRTLNEDNALNLGICGETHNSPVLLNSSAKFIVDNAIDLGWDGGEHEMKKHPKLMRALIAHVFKDGSNDPVESTLSTLERDMLSLLESGDNSDIVLQCQGEEIKAHRKILSAR